MEISYSVYLVEETSFNIERSLSRKNVLNFLRKFDTLSEAEFFVSSGELGTNYDTDQYITILKEYKL